jgi:hypothetical protein
MLMYDSTNPLDIPIDAPAVAGYIDGAFAWSDAGWKRFPDALKLVITVFGDVYGDVLDVETGDATPDQAVDWVRMCRITADEPYPGVYCNSSLWPTVQAAFAAHQVDPPWYWIADYDGRPDIPPGAVAKQYLNAPASGGHFDLSAISPALITYMKTGGKQMLSQDDANLIVTTLLDWKIVTPSAGPGVGRAVWDVLGDGERLTAQLATLDGEMSADQKAVLTAIAAAGAVGGDVEALANNLAGPLAAALAPHLPAETTPAEFFAALAKQLEK